MVETTEITLNSDQAAALLLCVDAYLSDLTESLSYHKKILTGEEKDDHYGGDMEKVREVINFENQIIRDLHSLVPDIKEAVIYLDTPEDKPSIILP